MCILTIKVGKRYAPLEGIRYGGDLHDRRWLVHVIIASVLTTQEEE